MTVASVAKPKPTQEGLVRAAELFGVLSTPVRLQIIGELCASERNVSDLLGAIGVSQPNMSHHLHVLYQAGVVTKRRSGAQVFYRIANDAVVSICKAVCVQVESQTHTKASSRS